MPWLACFLIFICHSVVDSESEHGVHVDEVYKRFKQLPKEKIK